jgi:hypothetical protein
LTESSRSIAGVVVPWGLWQEVHVIFSSRSGMCELRMSWARRVK